MREPNCMAIHPIVDERCTQNLMVAPEETSRYHSSPGGLEHQCQTMHCDISVCTDLPDRPMFVIHRATALAQLKFTKMTHASHQTWILPLPLHTFVTYQMFYCHYFVLKKWLIFNSFVCTFPLFAFFLSLSIHSLLVSSLSTTRPSRQYTRWKTLWKRCWTCCRDTGRRQGIKWQKRAAASSPRPASFLLSSCKTSTVLWSVATITHWLVEKKLPIYQIH